MAPASRGVCLPTAVELSLVFLTGVCDCAMAFGSGGLTLIAAIASLVACLVPVLLALAENQLVIVLVHLGNVVPEQLLVVDPTASQF